MQRRRFLGSLSYGLGALTCSCAGAEPRPPEIDSSPRTDGGGEPDERAPDFELVVLDTPRTIAPDTSAPLRVRVDRIGGFDAPVLLDLWGLPDTVWAQPREARVGDGALEITLVAGEDAEAAVDAPYAIQASALGIRRVHRTTLTIVR